MMDVMTLYTEGEEKSPCKANYNYLHLASQMVVECALGLLKNHFQILLKPLNTSARNYVGSNISATTANGLVINVCMCLHNVLIDLNNNVKPISEVDKMRKVEAANNITNMDTEVVLGDEARAR